MKHFLRGSKAYWRCAFSYVLIRFKCGSAQGNKYARLIRDFWVLLKKFWDESNFEKYEFVVKASYDPSLLMITRDFDKVIDFELYKNEKMKYPQGKG